MAPDDNDYAATYARGGIAALANEYCHEGLSIKESYRGAGVSTWEASICSQKFENEKLEAAMQELVDYMLKTNGAC